MSGTAVIVGNSGVGTTAMAGGGGVYVANGIFNMSGGTIKGNRAIGANGKGGDALIGNTSTFNKTGGVIYGNGESANSNNANLGSVNGDAVAIVDMSAVVKKYRDITISAGLSHNGNSDSTTTNWNV